VTAVARPGVAEYLTGVLGGIEPLPPLLLALLEARGGVLAEDILARQPLPACDIALVDGYAVRAADLAGASATEPVTLAVLGDLRASSWEPANVSAGTCYAVASGAPVPTGADAVVPAAWTDQGLATVSVTHTAGPLANLRRAGSQLPAGALVAGAGATVTPALIGLLAAAGVDHILTRPKPRVAVFSTGDELVETGVQTGPGQVVDANSYALTAAAADAGGQAVRAGIAGTDTEPLRDRLEDHSMRADVLVISGGTGDGPDDTVRRLLGWDGTVEFAALPLHPSGVLGFGRLGPDQTPVVCLPGDPAAALIGFEIVVRPILRRLAGLDPVFRPSVKANLLTPVTSPIGVREFRPASVAERRGGGYTVEPIGEEAQLLASLAQANALLVLGEKAGVTPAGTAVDVLLLDRSR
jgi:molybdopterin molybdotransferase